MSLRGVSVLVVRFCHGQLDLIKTFIGVRHDETASLCAITGRTA